MGLFGKKKENGNLDEWALGRISEEGKGVFATMKKGYDKTFKEKGEKKPLISNKTKEGILNYLQGVGEQYNRQWGGGDQALRDFAGGLGYDFNPPGSRKVKRRIIEEYEGGDY